MLQHKYVETVDDTISNKDDSMTTVEQSKLLDLEVLNINISSLTAEEKEVVRRIGRVVRNLQLLDFVEENNFNSAG